MNEQDRKAHLKKEWRSAQRGAQRALLPLDRESMRALFDYIGAQLQESPCNHTLDNALRWISDNEADEETVTAWLADNGGFCDCEAVANARQAWDDALKP